MSTPGGHERPRFDFEADLPALEQLDRIHFVAIAGSGMSGVASLYASAGSRVTGSDTADNAAVRHLRAQGAHVYRGHDAAQVGDASVVVVSGAVPEDNPELARAREQGLPVLHRAQAIAVLSRSRDALAVAGTNGKTTTSAMAVAVLSAAGGDPGFVIGSPLVDRGTSASLGSGPMVIEADESDRSFVAYRPRVAIVTNVTPDHLDFYGDFAGVQQGYADFVATMAPGGTLVSNADDAGSRELAAHARRRGTRVVTWGESAKADLRIGTIAHEHKHTSADLTWRAGPASVGAGSQHRLSVPLPGAHNLHNAAAALLAGVAGYGIDVEQGVHALAGFAGTRRRFETVGRAGGVEVIDDYAHNGPKVAAVVRAGRSVVGEGGRLVVAFQPHMYSRTRAFAEDFAQGLRPADVVIVLDVYGARESPLAGVSGETIVSAMRSGSAGADPRTPPGVTDEAEVYYVADRQGAAERITTVLRPGDVLLTVGAGDITTLGPEVLRRLEGRRG
ncbi:MAG TPA: UDP-N-acetylmuramate--L-alanine ligase [Ornithinimicrobium sp.]|uniref:UDP-N-acetylmuramate--L-alanine ligase n=1 Tax=Ornithinimicrobium sp. TaxID=1977084 RepID=UPI002B4A2C39|nr:UDP-N-acetylmuramate--L-alanine ligase [Ornithinimicrobium sp.]HKJ11948.1 UDP-N-acetylmuramate--L-alanine ligase [Ornithinimicrobium sp.]